MVPVLAACSGGATPRLDPTDPLADREPRREPDRGPAVAVVRALPAGEVLDLRPTERVGGSGIDPAVVDGLLHAALRQSPHLDFAGGVERCPSAAHSLAPVFDPETRRITVALWAVNDAPTPLAAVGFADRDLPSAIDELARSIRLALGERLTLRPLSVSRAYSADLDAVRFTEQAHADERRGLQGSALDRAVRALREDPGCPPAILVRTSLTLAGGDLPEAERMANQALVLLGERLTPSIRHRLARLLLLARAERAGPAGARAFDDKLRELGVVSLRERPFDPHARFSRALGNAYLSRFDAALPDFRNLRARWPDVPWIGYHLCFAELAAGTPQAALDAIEGVDRQLPEARTLLPRALALYHAGHHVELSDMLQRAGRRAASDQLLAHEILRMQAAHAILLGDADAAARHVLEDLEWLRARPEQLEAALIDVVDGGEVLVELGFGAALMIRLEALRAVQTNAEGVGHALAYLAALATADNTADPTARMADSNLVKSGRTAWAARLRGFLAWRSGDLGAAANEFATALRLADEPLSRARFAQVLLSLGREEQADQVLAELRDDLLRIDLRRPLQHPLSGPGRALAFLATQLD